MRQPNAAADVTPLLALVRDAAQRAGSFIQSRARDRSSLTWHAKSAHDFVSDVDTGAETIIRERLLSEEPDARIVGEELSPTTATGAGLTFVVDPLDGTTNFLHGYPWYAVSIAALRDDALVASVVLNAVTNECFTAAVGAGAQRNGEPIRVSPLTEPARALIGTGFPFKRQDLLPRYTRQFDAVSRATAGIRRAGSAALDLADVACGRFDAFWELDLAPWDFAAGVLLVREAGGIVTTVDSADVLWAPSSILAGNPVLHAWLAAALREDVTA